MCTITWRITRDDSQQSQQLIIVANRDESRQRPSALPPQVFDEGSSHFTMPIDPQGGGSWIATNAHGLTIALLNNYEADVVSNQAQQGSKRSRGLLVKDLASCESLLQAESLLHNADMQNYAPFHLLIFAGAQHPICWSWSGVRLHQQMITSGALSTSAWGSSWVPKIRERFLIRRLSKVQSNGQHIALLRQQKPLTSSIAVAMEREDAMTVSTTVIEVSRVQSRLTYYAGHPKVQTEGESIQLQRQHDALHLPEQHAQSLWQTRVEFDALFRERAPQLASRLPWFAFPLLRWVLKERALNSLFSRFDQVAPENFCDQALQEIGVGVSIDAKAWPAVQERPVFLSNHPSGGLDGIVLIAVLKKRYPNLRVVANDVLKQISHMQDWVVPVNVFGNSKQSLKDLQAAFAGAEPILLFPAGKTARRNEKNQLDDGDWSNVPVKLAARNQRAVVPLYLQAHNSSRFDLIAKWRQRFGIQMNIEMLLLVRELMKPACKQYRVKKAQVVKDQMLAQVAAERKPGAVIKKMSYAMHEGA